MKSNKPLTYKEGLLTGQRMFKRDIIAKLKRMKAYADTKEDLNAKKLAFTMEQVMRFISNLKVKK